MSRVFFGDDVKPSAPLEKLTKNKVMNKTSKITLVIVLILIAVGVYFLAKPKADIYQQDQGNNSTSYDIGGMTVEILKQGTGEGAKSGDTVTVNYVGTLQNGTKFDSSIDRGQPFQFDLGRNSVIQGWELGVVGIKVGEKRKLTIPPELAYGSRGAGEVIPPNATLIFEIEMLIINTK